VAALEDLYREYGEAVEFRLIYIRPTGEDGQPDAPPVSPLAEANREVKTEKDRAELVGACVLNLKITFPASMDDGEHLLNKLYNAWPSRACLVDKDGVLVYASKPGIASVDPEAIAPELEKVLGGGSTGK
jgi:hypothetical protein